ncbi:hypothetical protein FNL56_19985 [Tardiphaga sp. vice304]|uniref:hypothetical protein n=1 Tax=Tardiphaga sp. vice304 TaxID=2592817 RepID=UPI001163E4AE|nr:hypothetical protein [Tardiphaga sp. vice304]QDM28152.1 hypothetical protein FNL56_19985 [Tardiphaga sp. vice304]
MNMHLADLNEAKLEIKRISTHISNLCSLIEAAKPLAKNETANVYQSLITQLRDLLKKSRIFNIYMFEKLTLQIDRMSADKLQDLFALLPLITELENHQSRASEKLRLHDEEKREADHPEESQNLKSIREAIAKLAAGQTERDRERRSRRQSGAGPRERPE